VSGLIDILAGQSLSESATAENSLPQGIYPSGAGRHRFFHSGQRVEGDPAGFPAPRSGKSAEPNSDSQIALQDTARAGGEGEPLGRGV
jgi:hypothetical protein